MRLTNRPSALASALASRPLRQRGARVPVWKRALRIGGIVALVCVVVIVAAAVILLSGPTEIGIVRDRAAAILQANLGPDYAVAIDRAVVDIDPVLGLIVRLDDVEVRDGQNAVIARVPSTRLAIDGSSLLSLRVEVSEMELSGARLSFVRADDGEVYLGNAGTVHATARDSARPPSNAFPSTASGGFPDLLVALQIVDRGIEPAIDRAVEAGFQRFSLINSTIEVWDAERRQQRSFRSTDISISVDPATSTLAMNFATSGYGGRWSATLDREVNASSGGHVISAVFSQLTLADIFPGLGEDRSPLSADIPIYGRANITFGSDGGVEDARVRLDLGAGIIRFEEGRESVLLDEATVKLRWDVANQAVVLEPSTFFFGETRGVVSGRVVPVGDPTRRQYAFELDSPGAILAPSDSNEAPVIAQRITVAGTVDMQAKLLAIDNAAIVTPNASVAAAGSIGFDGPTPSLAAAVSFSPMSVAELKQMWIPFIAPGARRWVMEHIKSGQVISGRFEAAVPAGILWTGKPTVVPDEVMRFDLRVEDVAFTTFGNLPAIERANGNVVLTGSTLGVDIESGEIAVPSGKVTVNAGAFAISDTGRRPAEGVIALQLSGDAASLGYIADSDPLRTLANRKLTPGDLSGTGDASVSVRVPLKAGLTDADIDWKVTVVGRGLASRSPVEGRSVSEADVTLVVTPDEVAVNGKAKIDGAFAPLALSIPVSGTTDVKPGERRMRLVLDAEARKRLGVGLDQVLGGTMTATVTNLDDSVQHYDLDLTRARVMLAPLGWSKGINVPAKLSFDLAPADDGYAVHNLVFEGEGFGFSGTALVDESYGLVSADITRLALRKGDSMAIRLTGGRSGYGITVTGSSFDLRGLIAHIRDKSDEVGNFPDLAIDARVNRLVGYNQEVMTNAALSLVSVGGETQKMSFSGSMDDAKVSLTYKVGAEGTTLLGSADDAGRLMRFVNLYSRFAGGTVNIAGQAGASGPMTGTFELSRFDVINEPAMGSIIPTSQPGLAEAGFDPGRVHFDRLFARFRKTDRTITIEEALLRGSDIGATFAGRFDLAAARVSVTGTYIPNYSMNNFFGQIPIIGLALGGGAKEGLFGVTFKIDGPLAEPAIFVNPLSAVAPGIFRKIFEFQ